MSAASVLRARALLADVLGLEPGALPADAAPANVAAWDSLAHVRLVLRLEEELGRSLAPEEVLAIRDVDAMAGLLHTSQAS